MPAAQGSSGTPYSRKAQRYLATLSVADKLKKLAAIRTDHARHGQLVPIKVDGQLVCRKRANTNHISSYGRQAAPKAIPFFHHDVRSQFRSSASEPRRTHFMEGCGPSDRPLGCAGASEVAMADPVRSQDRRTKGGQWSALEVETT